jgi:hypothetical protein
MFEETLEFKIAILLCYGRQKILNVQQRVPKAQMWAIVEFVITSLNLVVITCVLNQSRSHGLLSNVLMTIINLIVAMKSQLDPLVDGIETCDQFDVELHMFNKNMRQEVVKVIKPFLQFLMAFDSRHVHSMLTLMLDPCYKSL